MRTEENTWLRIGLSRVYAKIKTDRNNCSFRVVRFVRSFPDFPQSGFLTPCHSFSFPHRHRCPVLRCGLRSAHGAILVSDRRAHTGVARPDYWASWHSHRCLALRNHTVVLEKTFNQTILESGCTSASSSAIRAASSYASTNAEPSAIFRSSILYHSWCSNDLRCQNGSILV